MEITRSGIAALIALCGAAGAGGAYLATRATVEPAPTTAAATTAATTTPPVAADDPVPALAPSVESAPLPVSPRPQTRANSAPSARPVAPPAIAAPAPTIEPAITAGDPPAATTTAGTATETQSAPESTRTSTEPAAIPAPAAEFEELIVARDAVLGLQMDSTVSSETARIEDQVMAHVTRDLRVGDRVAIPAGTKVYGNVTMVERGGRVRERARLGVRFSTLALADGSRVPISTDVIFRDGDAPSRESAAKIGGGAIGGAIIGGILGGGKGAIIGGTAGAGAGTAAVMAGGRNAAVLAAGTPVTVRFAAPAAITIER